MDLHQTGQTAVSTLQARSIDDVHAVIIIIIIIIIIVVIVLQPQLHKDRTTRGVFSWFD